MKYSCLADATKLDMELDISNGPQSTVGRRAFAMHGRMVWNSLPDDIRAQQDYESFRRGLKTWLFSRY